MTNCTNGDGIAPCHVLGTKPNKCALAVYDMKHYGKAELGGPWKGWRLAGNYLVTPDGTRMLPGRVIGLAWRQDAEARRDRARAANEARKNEGQMVRVVVVTLAELSGHANRYALTPRVAPPTCLVFLIVPATNVGVRALQAQSLLLTCNTHPHIPAVIAPRSRAGRTGSIAPAVT